MSHILAIDIGNTRAKYAIFDDDEIVELSVFEPYSNDLKKLRGKYRDISRCIITSVGGKVDECLEQLGDIEVITLSSGTKLPFEIGYERAEQIGSDRIAAVSGAMAARPGQNNLVIDIGTCITYDIITSEGQHQAGPISPGIKLRFKSMNAYTEKLPLCEPVKEEIKEICMSTKECLQSGVINGISFEIEGFIKAFSNIHKNLNVFIIGGDNIFFENKLKNCIFADANFTFNGLRYILNYQ